MADAFLKRFKIIATSEIQSFFSVIAPNLELASEKQTLLFYETKKILRLFSDIDNRVYQLRFLMLFGSGILFMFGARKLHLAGAGALGTLCCAFFTGKSLQILQ